MSASSVSVIIPVFQGGEKFARSLDSVVATDPPPREIIVVNDGGPDDFDALQSHSLVRVSHTERRGGPAGARNLGAARASGTILFFLDADVVVRPDIIQQVAGILDGEPAVDAIFGSYDDEPLEGNVTSQFRNLLHHYVHQQSREEAVTFWGACGAVRRAAFEAVNGFDARQYDRPSIEDVELGIRLSKAGYRIRLCKDLQIKHLKRWTISSMVRTDFARRALPWTRLILETGGLRNDLNTTIRDRISVAAAVGLGASLVAAPWLPWTLWIALLCILTLFYVNRRLYAFLHRKRGLLFAVAAMPLHWLHFLASGIAFAIGTCAHVGRTVLSRGRKSVFAT